jgi:hypothetical protein
MRTARQTIIAALFLACTAATAMASNDHAGPTTPGARNEGPKGDAGSCRPPSVPASNDHAGPTHPGCRTAGPTAESAPRPMPPLASDAHAAPWHPGARVVE